MMVAKKKQTGPKTKKEKAVWQACEALVANNKQPTYLAIGEQLVKMGYKRGSNSDIRRYLNSWKEQTPAGKKAKAKQPVSTSKPPIATEFSPQLSLQSLMDLYIHHNQQIDRLMHVIELQRKENKILRDRLQQATTQLNHTKPRVKVSFNGKD